MNIFRIFVVLLIPVWVGCTDGSLVSGDDSDFDSGTDTYSDTDGDTDTISDDHPIRVSRNH